MARILVVDDEPDVAFLLEGILGASGHETFCAQSGEEALRMIAEMAFDLMIIDVMMPGMSGFELVERLRSEPDTQTTPIMFLSALAESRHRTRGIRAGGDDYVNKPFDVEELMARVERLLERVSPGHDLSGDIDQYSLVELLQSLEQSRRSGTVAVQLETGQKGSIALAEGNVAEVRLGRLVGDEALLAMIASEEGRFTFVGGEVDAATTISLMQSVMQRSYLKDEIAHRRHLLSAPDLPLEATENPPRRSEDELAREIYYRIHALPKITLAELVGQEIAAPMQTELAALMLIDGGFVVVASTASTDTRT